MTGPFSTEQQARESAHEVVAPEPGWSILGAAGNRELLTRALDGAGVALGAYDERILVWLAGFTDATCAVVAGWVTRAGGSRCQRCGRPAPEGNDWCAACEHENAAQVLAVLREAASGEPGGAR
jgi:hypothetical protein